MSEKLLDFRLLESDDSAYNFSTMILDLSYHNNVFNKETAVNFYN